MIHLEKLSKNNFKERNFNLILGDEATYNIYYEIFWEEQNLKIGLHCFETGIAPQIEASGTELLVGASDKFYIIGKDKIIKEIDIEACFYEFIILNHNILILNETSLIMLDDNYNEQWKRYFSEIIANVNIIDCMLKIKDYMDNTIMLQLETGEIIN